LANRIFASDTSNRFRESADLLTSVAFDLAFTRLSACLFVEGTIALKENSLTIGENGSVKANAVAKTITIEGEVEGDLYGAENIVIRQSSNVRGNLVSPRVSLKTARNFVVSIWRLTPRQSQTLVAVMARRAIINPSPLSYRQALHPPWLTNPSRTVVDP